ncbi:surface protease GP63 [Trypanosoma cruzi]|nr:surface protease GP63 [Trypanosoma cruzi]
MVRDMPLRAQDASRVDSGFGKDRRVAVRINVSTRDLDDSRKHRGFSWCHAMNSLNENRHCEDGFLSSVHGNILAEETVPAAVKLHEDCLLVRPLEGPLIVYSFATGSVCSWFTVPDGHRSTGVPNSVMVMSVAAASGGVWALRCVALEDGRPVAGTMNIACQFHFTDASPRT